MKAILEFNLPEDRADHRLALDGWKWRCVVEEVLSDLRNELKYGEPPEAVGERLEALRTEIHALMQEYNLTLDVE